jgi:hypothetical protein
MISRSLKTAALVAAILGTIGAAHATSLLPGTGPVAIDTADLPAGTFVATATGTVNGGGFTGSARTAVYRETATNFLDVIYQFTDLSGSSIVSISGSNFDNFVTNVFQSATLANPGIFIPGTIGADVAQRSTDGNVVEFIFTSAGSTSQLLPGTTSFALQVRTNATNFTSGFMGVLGSGAGSQASFQPTAAIPEPETYAMMLAGLGLMGFVGARRKNTEQ